MLDGYIALQSDTFGGYTLIRSNPFQRRDQLVALASRHAIPAINQLQGTEMNETSRIKELPRLPPSKTVLGIGGTGPHAHACVAFVAERFDGRT
jgi:hypothetical protein